MFATLFVFSLGEAVTFRLIEEPDSSIEGPHEQDAEFYIHFMIDAIAPSEGEDPENLGNISAVQIRAQFDNSVIEPVDLNDPFVLGDYLTGFIPFNNEIRDGNILTLNVGTFGGGAPREDDRTMATVKFKMLIPPPNTTSIHFLDPGGNDGTTFGTKTTGATKLAPTTVDKDDVSLPVDLSLLTVVPTDMGVLVKWRTESEINNLGFDVYRSESRDGKYVKVNPAYIKGAGTDGTPHDYQFVDESTIVGKTYYYYLEAISFSGERERSHIIKVIVDASGKVKVTGLMQPTRPALLQNFPNPFNPETWIPFHLAKDADVTIRIFDIRGQEIRTINLGQTPAGYYDTKGKAVLWDGRDSYGQEVSSGIYFYNLTAGKFHATRKLTIIK